MLKVRAFNSTRLIRVQARKAAAEDAERVAKELAHKAVVEADLYVFALLLHASQPRRQQLRRPLLLSPADCANCVPGMHLEPTTSGAFTRP